MMKFVLAASLLAAAPFGAQAADITVPPGFRATVAFDGAGPARHMAFDAHGALYVSSNPVGGKAAGILALRDTDGDGRFDEQTRFGDVGGTGIRFHNGDLYATSASTLYRYRFNGGELAPSAAPDVIVSGMPTAGFASRAIAFDDKGGIFIGIGGGGNTCVDRSGPTPKPADPCTELLSRGGIWRYDGAKVGQRHPADGLRFASGVRDMQALDFSPVDHTLYAVMQGRNGVAAAAAKQFGEDDNQLGVAEEMHRVVRGSNLGWPYTHFDARTGQRIKAPEYGGKPGDAIADGSYSKPLVTFPSHSSPLDMTIYSGKAFPAAYRGGTFVAFRGGSDGDRQQNGYNIWFVPAQGSRNAAKPTVFADGFAGADRRARTAEFRPTGVAVSPNGALYVMDGNTGRIWRIDYVGRAPADRR